MCHHYLIEFFMLFASALLFIVHQENYCITIISITVILLKMFNFIVLVISFRVYGLVICFWKCSIYCSYYLVYTLMRSFLFYEIMDWKRLVLCFIILLFRFRSCEVRLSHFSLFVISFFTFILSRYVYVSALLAFHLSLMKLIWISFIK